MMPLGHHLLADLAGCEGLADPARIEAALRQAVAVAGATLLDLRLHHFGSGQGVTGVALLAESHLSIHSWPEHGFAAVDIFLCGPDPACEAALAKLVEVLGGTVSAKRVISRGLAPQQ